MIKLPYTSIPTTTLLLKYFIFSFVSSYIA
nr:MAG TPA: hypothetical protein [Caudoviricetes sp.]